MCTLQSAITGTVKAAETAYVIAQTKEEERMQKYKTELANLKIKSLKEQAGSEYQKGVEEARKKKLNSILNMGTLMTNAAASNIAVSSSTFNNIFDDEKLNGELEALNTYETYKNSADSYTKSAKIYHDETVISNKQSSINRKYKIIKSVTSGLGAVASSLVR